MSISIKTIAEYTSANENLINAVIEQCPEVLEYTECIPADAGYAGFTYYHDTVEFTECNMNCIKELSEIQSNEFGCDSLFSMVSNFGCINLKADEVAEAMYNDESENRTELFNALAWYALEEVVSAIVNAKEDLTEVDLLNIDVDELIEDLTKAEGERDGYELNTDDYEEEYKEMLDESGDVDVCGVPFSPSRIIEQLDPTMFRCGLIDYVDCINIEDTSEWQEFNEKCEEIEAEIEGLQEKITELEEAEEEE
jgi:hypothetical protein